VDLTYVAYNTVARGSGGPHMLLRKGAARELACVCDAATLYSRVSSP
jgi:hypothetical protein